MRFNGYIELSFLRCKARQAVLISALLVCPGSARFYACAAISSAAQPSLSHIDAENALSQAQALPAVYAADLMLRVASGARFQVQADQARFVSSALDLVADVPLQTKLRGLLFLQVDSAAGLESDATLYGIDKQSLTLRAVSAYLLMGDAAAARRVFQQLQLNPKPVPCGSELAPDFAFYYKIAGLGELH